MGQASRRGNYKLRKKAAIMRNDRERAARIRANREQEQARYDNMTLDEKSKLRNFRILMAAREIWAKV